MKRFTLTLLAALLLGLSACSKNDAPGAVAPATVGITAQNLDHLAANGKGFTVGAVMSAQTVYVLFDPQCPHCGHLWQASLPLHDQVKFVWLPIAFSPAKSLAQAAALLSASNPTQTMTEHERSLLAGTGGMSAPANVAPEMEAAVKRNTALLATFGVDSVPFLISKHRQSGQLVSHTGALDSQGLSRLLGL